MRFRTTIIIGILALILGAFYVVFDVMPQTRIMTTEERVEAGMKVFVGKDFISGVGAKEQGLRELATRLDIKRDGEKVILERVAPQPEEKWRMTSPISADASVGEAGQICYALQTLQVQSVVRPAQGEKLDLSQYGLDKPQASVTFTIAKSGEEPVKWTLLAGVKDPTDTLLYVKRADRDEVYGVDGNLLAKLRRPVNELRDPTVIAIVPDKVTAVGLRVAEPPSEARCERKDNVWRVTTPVSDYADESRVRTLISTAEKLKIKPDGYVTEDDSQLDKYGLDKPTLTISIAQGDKSDSLLIGAQVKDKAEVYARLQSQPTIFKLEKKDTTDFTTISTDLRSRSAMRFTPDAVEKIGLDLPTEKVVVSRKNDKWQIESPAPHEAATSQVKEFLYQADRLDIQGWADEKDPDLVRYGLQIPLATVKLTLRDGAESVLIMGKPMDDGFVYARRGDGGPLLKLKSEFLNNITAGRLIFFDKTVSLSDGVILSVTFEGPALPTPPDVKTVVKIQDGKYLLESPVAFPADEEAMRIIVRNVSAPPVTRYVEQAPKDLARYGLDKPYLKATITYEKTEGDRKTTMSKALLVGGGDNDWARYAMVEGGDTVFTLGNAATDPIKKRLASRAVCEFDKARATSIAIEERQDKSVYEKQDKLWRKTQPVEAEADAKAIDYQLSAMSNLVAASIADYSATDLAKYGLDNPSFIVTVKTGDAEYKVTIGANDYDGNYYACTTGPLVYLLTPINVQRLTLAKPAATPAQ